jgi:hypothetical protein
MVFKLSKEYIRKRKTSPLWGLLVFALIASIFVLAAFSKDTEQGAFFLIAMVVAGLLITFQNLKLSKFWEAHGPKVAFQVNSDHFLQIGRDGENKIMVEAIENVRLQMRRGKIHSIFFKSKTGRSGKLEGFENMEALAEQIKNVVGPNKVSVSRFLHR